MEYTPSICCALFSVAFFYVLAQIYVTQLYFILKASWARVCQNLQVIVTFIFDIQVAGTKFSAIELSGCALLLVANAYLFLSEYYFPQDPESST